MELFGNSSNRRVFTDDQAQNTAFCALARIAITGRYLVVSGGIRRYQSVLAVFDSIWPYQAVQARS